jgi:serine/threonine protein kinase
MEDLTGKMFGVYEIAAPLGEGGMAAVYKAYQPAMKRFVALKVLSRKLAESGEFTSRFQREALMLAQLQHPHILPVFDYGQVDGYSYIVMPFLQNGTLAELLQTRRRSLTEVYQIITQIGGALGYAHARGMIHRDVKPSNVLIDEQGNCLLTDFGLARMVEISSESLTSAGAIMGTPAYMSPEQGKGDTLDGRSDLYSLGVILYEMLTGQVPYRDKLPMMVVIKHIHDPLPSARELVPDLSDAIERVLIKSLAKEPDERYQTAEDFVQAVQKAIQANPSGKAVSSALDSVYDRLIKKKKAAQNDAEPAKETTDPAFSFGEKTVISPPPATPMDDKIDPATPPSDKR